MRWRLLLVDDPFARDWVPLSSTRPVGEILFGSMLLRERIERATGLATEGYLTASGLDGFTSEGVPPVVGPSDAGLDDSLLVLNSRYVPPLDAGKDGLESLLSLGSHGVTRLFTNRDWVGWLLPPGEASRSVLHGIDGSGKAGPEFGKHPAAVEREVPGMLLATPWDLLAKNPDQLSHDLAMEFRGGSGEGNEPLPHLPGVHKLGDHPVSVGEEVRIDPNVVFDARPGPIHLESRVHVRSFTHLSGPALVGNGSTIFGGQLESFVCGPCCKLRGEISSSVILGYTNKAHDGYLGHSLVGRWVNLGAMTTNSDLKNNYGSIRVALPGGETDTGLLKLGVFLGDHVKTGIGTTLSAGTVVGVGSNLFGGGIPPKWISPFQWVHGREQTPYRLEAFLNTVEKVMMRRGVSLDARERAFLTHLWNRENPNLAGESER